MGFRLLRKSKGSHWQYEHPDGRRTTIPVHKGQDIGPGLLRKIMRDITQEFGGRIPAPKGRKLQYA
jgi:predicted RNA binding protein YcfA (HicA-like mRNA interferase family)